MRTRFTYEKTALSAYELLPLISAYKAEIGEPEPTAEQLARLDAAMKRGDLMFFIARSKREPIAMCSVTRTFSTYTCDFGGVLEDFYVATPHRKHGVASGLISFVFECCGVLGISALWVGASECDVGMYKSLGFDVKLRTLLSYDCK